jgi:3-oxosteroid 1-dehydrogenase
VWHITTDFLVVGSGAGGMTAAVTAHEYGADSVVIEKTDQYGGTSSLSGGVVWIPNNRSMAAKGITDCEQDGLEYLRQVTAGAVPEEKLLAYVKHGTQMIDFLSRAAGVTFEAATRYADYYPDLPGGKRGGRSMDPPVYSRRKLGKHAAAQRLPQGWGFNKFALTVTEGREVMDMGWKAYAIIARHIMRYYLDIRARRLGVEDDRLTMGRGLIGNLRGAMLERKIPLYLNTAANRLIVENGRVAGLIAKQDGQTLAIRARRGVLLAAGGFAHNIAMRKQYGQLPTGQAWSSASPGNTGDAINMALDVNAALEHMDAAWWTPSVRLPDGSAQALIYGKALPGSMFVDRRGRRFTNEASPYEDIVKAMWQHHKGGEACIPSFMVFDARFRHNYPAACLPPAKVQPDAMIPEDYKRGQFLKKADSLEQLAQILDIDVDGLLETVARYNAFARTGKDLDFGRGDSVSDRYYSDSRVKPNPNLAAIENAPFYALEIYPGDLGTKGGLKCDAQARVLDNDGNVIDGLYVTGNCSGSVMGNSYPGAGSTIGPSMTFGYIAALQATGNMS